MPVNAVSSAAPGTPPAVRYAVRMVSRVVRSGFGSAEVGGGEVAGVADHFPPWHVGLGRVEVQQHRPPRGEADVDAGHVVVQQLRLLNGLLAASYHRSQFGRHGAQLRRVRLAQEAKCVGLGKPVAPLRQGVHWADRVGRVGGDGGTFDGGHPAPWRRLLAEFLGTALLVAAVVGQGGRR